MTRPRLLAAAAVLALGSAGRADVVVVEVRPGGEAAKARLRSGDRLVSWRRTASKTAPSASGAFRAPWEIDELELAQVPYGPVTVVYARGARKAEVRLGNGEWRLRTRPEAESEKALWQTLDRAADLTSKARYADAKTEWEVAREASVRLEDDRLRALVLRAEARVLLALGDRDGTEGALREALAIRARSDPGGPPEALALAGLGLFLGNFKGREKEGEELVRKALAIIEKSAPGSLAHARVLMNAGGLATRREDLDEAARRIGHALRIASRLAPDGDAAESCYNDLGKVARSKGDFAAAEIHQQHALEIVLARDPQGVSAAAVWNSLGVIRKQRGDLGGAEEAYEQAAVRFERAAPGSMNVAGITANLGNVALERGDFVLAEERHRKSLAIREKLEPESRDVVASLSDLARATLLEGRSGEAKALGQRSVELSRKLAPGSLAESAALGRLAEVEGASGEWPAAEEHERAALAIGARLAPRSLSTAVTRRLLAEALLAQGRTAEALPLAREAVEIHRRLAPGTTSGAASWDVLAKALAGEGDDAGAEGAFEAGLKALEDQADRLGVAYEGASAFSSWTSDVYRDYIDFLVARGRGADALHVLERSRARRLLSMLKARDSVAARLPPPLARRREELVAAEAGVEKSLAVLDPEKDSAKLEAAQAKLRDFRTARAGLVSQLAVSDPLFASALHPQPLDLASIRAALDPGTLFLAWTVEPSRTLMFVVPSGTGAGGTGLEVRTIAVGAEALQREVELYRSFLASGEAEAARARVQAGHLGDLLLGPAARSLGGAKRLLLAPDGPLLTLPFGAIVAPESDGAWLAERLPYVVAPSATAFVEMRHGAGAKGPARLVVFADPVLPEAAGPEAALGDIVRGENGAPIARYRKGLAPLPGAREEAKAIARLWTGPKIVYIGKAATRERAHRLGRSVRYLHFATHALVDFRFPLESALALAPEEGGGPRADGLGLLPAWDIVDSMRLDADLVTLSGCETGIGSGGGGEGLVGLARAFQIAGARTVAASLWSVSDRSTKELMMRFYRGLARGQRKDDALQSAQRALIAGQAGSAFAHPWHWAAFELFGDGR